MIRTVLLTAVMIGLTATAGAATPAMDSSGATLTVGKGTVLVSNGSQFVTATPGQVLKPGDRVMVMTGGSATLNYAGGGSAALAPGSMADVGATNALTVGGQRKIGPMFAQAVGDDPNKKCRDSDGTAVKCGAAYDSSDPNSFGWGGAVAGGLLVGGGIALAIHAFSTGGHGRTTPVSP